MPEPVLLALVWHMHQPSYRDASSGRFLLPWTRLHATKDYGDMPAILRATPRVHVTFNLTPSLLDQLEAIGRGASDPYLDVARIPADRLSGGDRGFLLARFFDVNHERMLEPHARYRELHELAREEPERGSGGARGPAAVGTAGAGAAAGGGTLTASDLRDLQVWYHLAWVDPAYHQEEPIRSLFAKGRGFTEEEKGALLDWGVARAGSIEEEYRSLAATGQAELTTSAYHHPILPLLIDTDAPSEVSASIRLPSPPFRAREDAIEQVRRARAAHGRRFGAEPRGTWPPEGAVNDAALEILAGAGFAWAASDEAVLSAALHAAGSPAPGWPAAVVRPHRVETPAGPITMVFRDRKLSDLIGFTYARWDPEHAAEDFLARVRSAREAVPAGETPLVTVILDGENCWESYPEDGHPFLRALYARLERSADVRAVTVSEALERVPARSIWSRVPVGSWIRPDLGIWIGHSEKNRAWEELARARNAVEGAAAAGAPADLVTAAREEIYAAEASDWFWWYGDDHPSAHRAEFDRLFRTYLIRAHERVGAPVPASLRESLRDDVAEGVLDPVADGAGLGGATVPYARPSIDGRDTDYFEWRGAALYRAAGGAGSMHRASAALRSVRYGTDGRNLHVRLDLERGAGRPAGATAEVRFPGPPERVARVPLDGSASGSPAWTDAEGDAGDGSYAVGEILEIALPLARCGGGPGRRVRFRVALAGGGLAEEVAPASGWFLLSLPEADLDLAFWSAL